jgi:AcrR family transcriptional regulator
MSVTDTSRKKDTRERLLKAADRLFFTRGYEAVSTRDLTEAAGVNVAAVNYHFGGKEKLYREALAKRLREIAQRKLEVLDRVIDREGIPDLREIIRAYVSSFVGDILSSKKEERFVNIVSMEMSEDGVATDLLFKEFVSSVHRVMKDAIKRARPGLPEEKISLCIASITGQILHFIRARWIIKRMMGCGYSKEFIDGIVEHITDFSLKGIGE